MTVVDEPRGLFGGLGASGVIVEEREKLFARGARCVSFSSVFLSVRATGSIGSEADVLEEDRVREEMRRRQSSGVECQVANALFVSFHDMTRGQACVVRCSVLVES